MEATATKPKKKKSGIKLRKSEQARLERVRAFLIKLKKKLENTGEEIMYDRDELAVITADCIDTKAMKIFVGEGMTGGKFYHCLAAGWGPYYDEEAEHFEEWFEDFKKGFFTISVYKV